MRGDISFVTSSLVTVLDGVTRVASGDELGVVNSAVVGDSASAENVVLLGLFFADDIPPPAIARTGVPGGCWPDAPGVGAADELGIRCTVKLGVRCTVTPGVRCRDMLAVRCTDAPGVESSLSILGNVTSGNGDGNLTSNDGAPPPDLRGGKLGGSPIPEAELTLGMRDGRGGGCTDPCPPVVGEAASG